MVDARQRVVGFISDGDILNYLGKRLIEAWTRRCSCTASSTTRSSSRAWRRCSTTKNVMELATKRVVTVESSMDLGEACRGALAERRHQEGARGGRRQAGRGRSAVATSSGTWSRVSRKGGIRLPDQASCRAQAAGVAGIAVADEATSVARMRESLSGVGISPNRPSRAGGCHGNSAQQRDAS